MQLVTGSDPESISWAALAMVASRFVVGLGSLLASVLISERLEMVPWRDGTTAIAQGRGLFVSQALALAYTGSGPIVIGWLAGLDEVGAYVVIERLFTSVCGALLLLHTAAYPTMARLFHSDRRAYLTLARTVTIVYLCGAGAILCVGWVLRGPVLSYFYGANGARPESLYLLGLLWVTCGILGVMVTGYLVVSGQAQRVYRLTSLVLATSLAAGIPGALMFGAAGWMGGLLIGQLVLAPYALHYWNKEKVMYG
jgi:O-antigen/teichoic acid export membrane protein